MSNITFRSIFSNTPYPPPSALDSRRPGILSVLLVASCMLLGGQTALAAGGNVTATIEGTVQDSDQNTVANAQVTVNDPNSGFSRSVRTNANGEYSLKVPPGKYAVTPSLGDWVSVSVQATVRLGETYTLPLALGSRGETIEEIVIVGQRLKAYTSYATTGISLSAEDIELLPVNRAIESVALLAPGAVSGDNAFGDTDEPNLVSLGGASVAENVYYIDGMNVTNFRNGLGGSSVPFEFYRNFEIKAGGYSAEFGRSTGGVISATTRTGDNTFRYGMVSYFDPDFGSGKAPNTLHNDGTLYDENDNNQNTGFTTDFYASGPIIRDSLYFYVLYELQDTRREFTSLGDSTNRVEREQADDFYGANLLWHINENHSLSLTHFTDEREIVSDTYTGYDSDTNKHAGVRASQASDFRGGGNTILRYDGQLTYNLSMSALYGINEYRLEGLSDKDNLCPNVINSNPDVIKDGEELPLYAGCAGDFLFVEVGGDEREAYRLDFEWELGNHRVRFGMDQEVNSSRLEENYPAGNHYYRYYKYSVGTELNSTVGNLPDINGDGSDVALIRYRSYVNGGQFETIASAFYIEDEWQASDRLSLKIGLRSETFDNKNASNKTFIKLSNQIAPRLGAEYDLEADGSRVIYANWGRYHLPVANNTNARLSGAELFFERWFVHDEMINPETDAPASLDANGIPTSQEIGDTVFFGDGVAPGPLSIVDQDIKPMYQDEIILGYKHFFDNDWRLTVNAISREFGRSIDDISIPNADTAGIDYVLANPGTAVTYYREDANHNLQKVTIPNSDPLLGYPEGKRIYRALALELERPWDGIWSLQASWVVSRSWGNTEGLVKSDNGQDDAGLTTDFDFPGLMDGAEGYLPNDRRHQIKVWGNVQLAPNLRMGMVGRYQSGRPLNQFGEHSHPSGSVEYGQTYYVRGDQIAGADTADDDTDDVYEWIFTPRGAAGRTPDTINLDVNLVYNMTFGEADVEVRLDIFNLLNSVNATEIFEGAETAPGALDERLGLATSYQAPRSLRLGASLRF